MLVLLMKIQEALLLRMRIGAPGSKGGSDMMCMCCRVRGRLGWVLVGHCEMLLGNFTYHYWQQSAVRSWSRRS